MSKNMNNIINETFTKHLGLVQQHLKLMNETTENDFPADMERALKQSKKKGDHEQSAYYTQSLKGGGQSYAGWDKFKGSWAYEQWLKKPETQELIKAIKADYDRFSYMRENESIKQVDMTGKKCEKCKKGSYGERSQHDDMDGKVTCDKCGNRIDRYKMSVNETTIARDEGYDYDSDDGYDSRRDARHSSDGYVDSGPSLGHAQQKRANRIARAALDRRSVGQLYFYNVPSDKETLAIRMGLRKSKSGKWFSPGKPNDVATKEFGSPKEWSLPKE